jgi:hypothetical protein
MCLACDFQVQDGMRRPGSVLAATIAFSRCFCCALVAIVVMNAEGARAYEALVDVSDIPAECIGPCIDTGMAGRLVLGCRPELA